MASPPALARSWTPAACSPSSSFSLQRSSPALLHLPSSNLLHPPATSPLLQRSVAAHAANPFSLVASQPQLQREHVTQRQMEEWILEIKRMFQSMSLGEISVSPYDTAWVAMVPALNGSKNPQFPKSLNWIIDNQLSDGSWGNKELFLAYDRVCSTVACLVALKTWNIGEDNLKKGVDFIYRNINKIKEEADDYMPTAFEVVFSTMLEDAKKLGIDLPYNSSVVVKLQKERKKKLNE